MKFLPKPMLSLVYLAAAFLLNSCIKDKFAIDTNISAVKQLYTPDNGKYVKIQPSSGASLSFEWAHALAEDGTLVQYEVVFDTAGGNFSHPLYQVVSDGNGMKNTLSLSHKDLNKIANMAGIQPLATGTLQWTVISFKGINLKKADTSRSLVVQRPAGFTDIPPSVFLTGDATEWGAGLAAAVPMKSTGQGTFEIFTKLNPGTFYFADRNSGTPVTYSLQGNILKQGGTNTQASGKIYRIRLDFNNATADLTEINSVGVYQSAYGTVTHPLTYAGRGTWSVQQALIQFYQFSWGRDERYKFQFNTTNASGSAGLEYYGSTNQTNSTPPDATTPAAYYYIVPVDNSQWDYTYKFTGAADGKTCDITLDMNAGDTYTHTVKVH
jgi:hypothetical protein